jgi:hypothetical protein
MNKKTKKKRGGGGKNNNDNGNNNNGNNDNGNNNNGNNDNGNNDNGNNDNGTNDNGNNDNGTNDKKSGFFSSVKDKLKKTKKGLKNKYQRMKSTCHLDDLIVGTKTGLKTDKKKKMELILLKHPIFTNETNKVFIKLFITESVKKYTEDSDNMKIFIIILDCINSIENLVSFMYNIHNYIIEKDSDLYTYLKDQNKSKKQYIEVENNSDKIIELQTVEFSDVSIKKCIEVIVHVFVDATIKYQEYKIKKPDKNHDSKIITSLNNFFNDIDPYIKSNFNELIISSTENKKLLPDRINNFKKLLENNFKSDSFKETIDELYKEQLDKTEQVMTDDYFKDNQSSSYLFIVFGLFIGAVLTKLNVLS